MFDAIIPESFVGRDDPTNGLPTKKGGGPSFWIVKRSVDIVVCLLLLPLLVSFGVLILLLNPLLNRGPLFFVQRRMGKSCAPFSAIKFRSMAGRSAVTRGPEDPIEQDRISRFGRLLRKSRIDELPQILNVLNGDMSLIGPRPDYYEHALVYLKDVQYYSARFQVRPGISGLAQLTVGYVSDSSGTRRKVAMDIAYIQNANFKLEWWIFLRTIKIVVTLGGC